MSFARYAIFVTPPAGPLADFTAAWLGWDAAAGVARPPPDDLGALPAPVARITATPRKYGFHGTIKPPFRLAPGTDEAGLRAALATLCGDLAPVGTGALAVAELGPFLALRPSRPTPALDTMAARVVAALDGFRAPAGIGELARRRAAGLTARQEANLKRWGYPYVMEDFRYHMTLTGPMQAAHRGKVAALLQARMAPMLDALGTVIDLTLLGEDADGRFHHTARMPLGA